MKTFKEFLIENADHPHKHTAGVSNISDKEKKKDIKGLSDHDYHAKHGEHKAHTIGHANKDKVFEKINDKYHSTGQAAVGAIHAVGKHGKHYSSTHIKNADIADGHKNPHKLLHKIAKQNPHLSHEEHKDIYHHVGGHLNKKNNKQADFTNKILGDFHHDHGYRARDRYGKEMNDRPKTPSHLPKV